MSDTQESRPMQARRFAVEAHGDQKYGAHPYRVHLDAVAELAREHGEDAEVVAYLHDVVEDTSVEVSEIEERFGKFVADCVAILTDEPGEDRAEKKRKTYAKMAAVSGDLELALVVKAADRLANMLACVADEKTEKLAVYKQEHPAFEKAACRRDLAFSLWYAMEEIVASVQHGGFNYRFWSGDAHGLIRRRGRFKEMRHPEYAADGKWIQGRPSLLDEITGMGPDPWSSGGEWADEISLEKAQELAAMYQVDLFAETS